MVGMVMHGLVLNPNKSVAMEVKLLAEAIVLGDGNKLIAIGSRMLQSLMNDAESVCLVRECREFEDDFNFIMPK